MEVYVLHEKSEKLKKKKLSITTNKKVTKKLCEKIYGDIIITHTVQKNLEASTTSKMEPFVNMANYGILRSCYMMENPPPG